MTLAVALAQKMMQAFPHRPPSDNPWLWELTKSDPQLVARQPRDSYADEMSYPFHNYFGHWLPLDNWDVLDLGCYCGGKAAAWYERYGPSSITGIDTDPLMIQAARDFAGAKGLNLQFEAAFAEKLPFPDSSFDAVLSFDVLEHVRSVEAAMRECFRVLKRHRRAYLVFPSYFHPVEHHLGIVTKTPCLQWLFSGQTLIEAWNRIVSQRGDIEYSVPKLDSWERCYTLNGITIRKFDHIVKACGFITIEKIDPPLFQVGRNAVNIPGAKVLAKLCRVGQCLGLREFTTHRIVRVLEKP